MYLCINFFIYSLIILGDIWFQSHSTIKNHYNEAEYKLWEIKMSISPQKSIELLIVFSSFVTWLKQHEWIVHERPITNVSFISCWGVCVWCCWWVCFPDPCSQCNRTDVTCLSPPWVPDLTFITDLLAFWSKVMTCTTLCQRKHTLTHRRNIKTSICLCVVHVLRPRKTKWRL